MAWLSQHETQMVARVPQIWTFILWFFLSPIAFAEESSTAADPAAQVAQGEYLLNVGGCVHCHTSDFRKPLAGGRELKTPFGEFYTPNITLDAGSGLGFWSEEWFVKAVREGRLPGGSHYFPSFPYTSFTGMTDEDVKAIWAYLKTQPTFYNRPPAHNLSFPFNQRSLLWWWRWNYLYKKPKYEKRGAYLVEAVAHCTECHTPRDAFGGLRRDQWMAGSKDVVNNWTAPNITSDRETGLGNWTTDDWQRLLTTGIRPNGESIGGEMVYVLQGLTVLTPDDRREMIEYLMSLKPVENSP